MSCVLAIDSSGHGGSLALARDGGLLAQRDHDPSLGYAEELFGLLDRVLADAGLGLTDMDAIAVVRGPGSFTGLRIGVMTAKSLAWARQIPLYASGTLELLASCAAGAGFARAIAIQDAGADHVYAASFDLQSRQRMRGPPRRVALRASPAQRTPRGSSTKSMLSSSSRRTSRPTRCGSARWNCTVKLASITRHRPATPRGHECHDPDVERRAEKR